MVNGPTWVILGSVRLSYYLIFLAYTALYFLYWSHRLVVSLAGEDEDQYEQFMLPLTGAFEAVAQMFSTNSFNEQEAKVSPLPTGWPASAFWQPLTETGLASTEENNAHPYIFHWFHFVYNLLDSWGFEMEELVDL